MSGWQILAWAFVALVTVFRVAVAVGFVLLVVAVVRMVRAPREATVSDVTA